MSRQLSGRNPITTSKFHATVERSLCLRIQTRGQCACQREAGSVALAPTFADFLGGVSPRGCQEDLLDQLNVVEEGDEGSEVGIADLPMLLSP